FLFLASSGFLRRLPRTAGKGRPRCQPCGFEWGASSSEARRTRPKVHTVLDKLKCPVFLTNEMSGFVFCSSLGVGNHLGPKAINPGGLGAKPPARPSSSRVLR